METRTRGEEAQSRPHAANGEKAVETAGSGPVVAALVGSISWSIVDPEISRIFLRWGIGRVAVSFFRGLVARESGFGDFACATVETALVCESLGLWSRDATRTYCRFQSHLRCKCLSLPLVDEQVPMRPVAVHESGDEWNQIGNELLRRGVSVIDRWCETTVGGQQVLVGVSACQRNSK